MPILKWLDDKTLNSEVTQLLNVALFGMTAVEWRNNNPDKRRK